MVAYMKHVLFLAMLVAILISKGDCQCLAKSCKCGSKNVTVSQEKTRKLYNLSYEEYKVAITNQCPCEQNRIIFMCSDFESFTKVDPKLFRKENGILCTVKDGANIPAKGSVTFTYAWTQQAELSPMFSQSTC